MNALGIEGDGQITLIVAVIGAVLVATTTGLLRAGRTQSKDAGVANLLLGLLIVAAGFYDMNTFPASGLWLTLICGIAWSAGAGWQLAFPPPRPLRTRTKSRVSSSDRLCCIKR
jgi:hypothetical protein